jgi:hypothetical protein
MLYMQEACIYIYIGRRAIEFSEQAETISALWKEQLGDRGSILDRGVYCSHQVYIDMETHPRRLRGWRMK